jgi:acetyl-CoA acetyltransferase
MRAILAAHNAIEEGPGGLYEICEQLAGTESDEILARLKSVPEVAVAPHNDGPGVVEATRRALAKAGYNVEDFVSP